MFDDTESDEVELTLFEDFSAEMEKETQAPKGTSALKYDVLGAVGQGAMGEILLAKDQELRRKVAFKKVHAQMSSNRKVMGRFFTEAQITAQLDHPNIVPIYSLEKDADGNLGYSMKLIEGNTLKDLIKTAREQAQTPAGCDEDHDLAALLNHFLKVCDAIHYAHIKGVIHRDLKPANIMIGPYNEVYVMDWGIAKVISKREDKVDDELVELIQSDPNEPPMERTQMGQIMGTPRYMSPQQAAGKNNELDGSSDQFALGLILFELITLKPALKAKNQIELIKRILKVDLEPMVHVNPKCKVPKELQAIVRKSTEKKPPGRYATVDDMANDIRRYLKGEAVLAQPDTLLQKLMRWMSHNKELTLGLVFTVFLLSATATIWSLYQQQQALIAAQQHEQELSETLLKVGKKSQMIDGQFLRFESILNGIASSAAQLYEFGQPIQTKYYTNTNFNPPDLKESPYYKLPVSLDWHTFKLAPGIDEKSVSPTLERLQALRFTYQKAFQQSAPNILPSDVLEKGAPLVWIFVGFEKGIHASYPGKGGYPEAYDPRKRPWYSQSTTQSGHQWKKPYIDVGGKGWLLPCTQPVKDSKGKLLGVAGVEMTLDYIQDQFLTLTDLDGFKDSFLLNKIGQIMVSTQDKKSNFKMGTLINKDKELKAYPQTELTDKMKTQSSGYLEKDNMLYAYYQIPSLGWFFVVEISKPEV